LPNWNTLPQTTVKDTSGKSIEHFLKPLTDLSGNLFLPTYEWGKKIDEGTYGKIYQAYRKIYVKTTDETTGILHFKCLPDSKESIVIKESNITLTPNEEKQPYLIRKKIIENDNRLVDVKSFTEDAIEFGRNFDKEIDLLFLDIQMLQQLLLFGLKPLSNPVLNIVIQRI
jgi:hypothetical protein